MSAPVKAPVSVDDYRELADALSARDDLSPAERHCALGLLSAEISRCAWNTSARPSVGDLKRHISTLRGQGTYDELDTLEALVRKGVVQTH